MALWHWWLNFTGSRLPGTRWNLWWSGFGSAGIISGSIFTHTWQHYRSVNCHGRHCPWIARVPYTDDDGVEHKYCRHCHPILRGRHLTRAEIHARHDAREYT